VIVSSGCGGGRSRAPLRRRHPRPDTLDELVERLARKFKVDKADVDELLGLE
jgi:hypothetical protein